MADMMNRIRKLASDLSPDAVTDRRHLHKYPELSFNEFLTSEYIGERLEAYGIPGEQITGKDGRGTGYRTIIEGKNPEAARIVLRADIDALPIQEDNDVEYRSVHPGVMHACGHDLHTSIVLGTGRALAALADDIEGTIELIFQPGEEKTPGGAVGMIEAGVLDGASSVIGQHINPGLSAGTVGFRPGLMMASADEIFLTVRGQGGHGAAPHTGVDPVLITAHILTALQQVVSRNANPATPTVLSFGKVEANGATNVIPDEVTLEGTFRTVNEEWRADALKRVEKTARGIAESMGGSCEVEIMHGYPVLMNDEELTHRLKTAAVSMLGTGSVVDLPLVMWAEDFAYYAQEIPGCFYNLGVANQAKGWTSALHTSTLMPDESAIETGIALMTWLAVTELQYRRDTSEAG